MDTLDCNPGVEGEIIFMKKVISFINARSTGQGLWSGFLVGFGFATMTAHIPLGYFLIFAGILDFLIFKKKKKNGEIIE